MSKATLNSLRLAIQSNKFANEDTLVRELLAEHPLNQDNQKAANVQATELVKTCRTTDEHSSWLDPFLLEFGLSNHEGVALMCLAESLLRVPDSVTADRLIAEKIQSGDWLSHTGKAKPWLVNLASWGLVITKKLVGLDAQLDQDTKSRLRKLTAPIIRTAARHAMKLMGRHYVLGRSISQGIKRGLKLSSSGEVRLSFDMLGEAARTKEDAQRYFESYSRAIEEVGTLNNANSVIEAHGVSVKLSALHPQFHFNHRDTVLAELLPRITELALKAKQHNISLTIDAEEVARLEMSLDIFQALCENPELDGWQGLGFVVQAYQKRALAVAQWLTMLAEETNRSIMVRLVKGAYWDTEIKIAQEQGFTDYPVFTRKTHTDVCYLQCAQILLQANHNIYAQFATHNAHTAVACSLLARQLEVSNYEFQRLHGMGQALYEELGNFKELSPAPLRVYAPIGEHRDLLPYLVRRLLENGANSSFVNQFLDPQISAESLTTDCFALAKTKEPYRHSEIPLPEAIFLNEFSSRTNSRGVDLDDQNSVDTILEEINKVSEDGSLVGHSIVDGKAILSTPQKSLNPSDLTHVVGQFHALEFDDTLVALDSASNAVSEWSDATSKVRFEVLIKMAELIENHSNELISLINLEAGRTIPDCVAEIREAVDFCRYYAEESLRHDAHRPQGVFLCISPWNFPLAIFVGQVAAALATGNCVLAKPADSTPIIATRVVDLFHQAGVPKNVLHLLIGEGPIIGNAVLTDPRLAGVAFTGSTAVARQISQKLAEREGPSLPFIAETGGQNCMIVDSSALPEQVVDDVISSAFHSAGQRCSALRVLYLQDCIADDVLHMLKGGLSLLNVGRASDLSTDVGPIIEQAAVDRLENHLAKILPNSRDHFRSVLSDETSKGTFFAPTVVEIDSITQLTDEVFGPILHVIRYQMRDLPKVVKEINSTGYGLTFGVQTRIDAFADHLFEQTKAGNTYINRNVVGAVVGVNPFGGNGLSGTGPKAGGPDYLLRFLRSVESGKADKVPNSVQRIKDRFLTVMNGPTGELNELSRVPLGNLLVILDEQSPLKELIQICNLALAAGNDLTLSVRNMANQAQFDALIQNIDEEFHQQININEENLLARVSNKAHDGVLLHLSNPDLELYRARIALRKGAIIPLIEFDEKSLLNENLFWLLSQLTQERTKTENLVAKGGNTQLFGLNET